MLRGLAGVPVGDVEGFLAGLFVDGMSFDDESLADVWEIEVGVEFGGGPDFSSVDSAMLEWIVVDWQRVAFFPGRGVDQGFREKTSVGLSFLLHEAFYFLLYTLPPIC